MWFAVEAHGAVICASAPALKIFFKQYLNVTSFSGSFKKSYPIDSTSNASNSTGTRLDKFRKPKTRKMGLHDIVIDSQTDTFATRTFNTETLDTKDTFPSLKRTADTGIKPFTIFSSEERLSGAYDQDIYMETLDRRIPDEERASQDNQRTFFVETDESD
jgi:hypothetical protein